MRTVLILAAGLVALGGCAAPAMNGGSPSLAGVNAREEEPPAPPALRHPPRTLKNWGTAGSGGMY